MERTKTIIRTSITAIAVNVVLVLLKAAAGLMSNSIAILLDAVNNLGDALSSIVTIIGTKLAGRAPDKKHPYGYGRIEYLTSALISVIIIAAGITSFKESLTRTIHPEEANYSTVTLLILAAAVAAKLLSGRYVKAVGKRIRAQSLIASGSDAMFDAILSLATLAAAAANILWHLKPEGILGLVISCIIIKAGAELLLETLNSIIGVRADKELTRALKEKVGDYEEVKGVYDLTLHNYGPTQLIGSLHIEVADSMTAQRIHGLTRKITADVYNTFGIILTVGIYASNTSDEKALEIKNQVEELLQEYPQVLQMHGFYIEQELQAVSFDLIMDFEADASRIREEILQKLTAKYPDHHFAIIIDSDYSD